MTLVVPTWNITTENRNNADLNLANSIIKSKYVSPCEQSRTGCDSNSFTLPRFCCGIFQRCRCIGISLSTFLIFISFPLLIIPFLIVRCFPCIPLPKSLPAWSRSLFNRGGTTTILKKASEIQVVLNQTNNPLVEHFNPHCSFPFAVDRPQIIFYQRNNVACAQSNLTDGFDPNKPTILFVHGYEPGTTARGFRETFVTPSGVQIPSFPMVPTGDMYIDQGYNICAFYWNQFSDEPDITVAEKKIYTKGPHRCAIKSSVPNSGNGPETVSFQWFGDQNTPSIAVQLCNEYVKYFGKEYRSQVTMVGHSMGSQLSIEATRLLLNVLDSNNFTCKVPESLAKLYLLDPFFSRTTVTEGQKVAERATETLKQIKTKYPKIVIETQVTSLIGEGWFTGFCQGLVKYTNYRFHYLPDIGYWNIKDRHCIAQHIFMCENLMLLKSNEKNVDKKDKNL